MNRSSEVKGPKETFQFIVRTLVASGPCGIKDEAVCCPSYAEQMFPYTKFGRLRVQVGTPIYECNKRCLCGPTCSNRVVQKGQKIKLCIFR